tara:strand:+ start:1201 stop:2154 length:954 start_codon:yes stop_codon:yes gene_type:complete
MRWRKLTVSAVAVVLVLAVGEIAMRGFFGPALRVQLDERNLLYRYDAELGWFPVANSRANHTGVRQIDVQHNSRGFRDPEHEPGHRPGLLILGDSFVWGYDAEVSERFSELLRERMSGWDVYNLGISGYGTDQEYLLLQGQFDHYRPALVLVVYCQMNDEANNSSSVSHGYHKPYFRLSGDGEPVLDGTPVPRSAHYFFAEHRLLTKSYWIRLAVKPYFKRRSPPTVHIPNPTAAIFAAMRHFLAARDATLIVGFEGANRGLQAVLESEGIPVIDLDTSHRYFTYGRHWTPRGHRVVADRIHAFLADGGFLGQPRRR